MIAVPKIVLIILVIVVVWYAMRWWNRAPQKIVRRRQASSPAGRARPAWPRPVAMGPYNSGATAR